VVEPPSDGDDFGCIREGTSVIVALRIPGAVRTQGPLEMRPPFSQEVLRGQVTIDECYFGPLPEIGRCE
jgi:hypothetical protein